MGGDGKALSGMTLDPGASAALRDQLVREAASLGSAMQAAQWARAALPAKNTLTASDARLVEVAFELRLSSFETEGAPRDSGPAAPETPERAEASSGPSGSRSAVVGPRRGNGRAAKARQTRSAGIDKSVLPIGEPHRYRDRVHLEFVASQPCLVCGRRPSDAHHLRFAQQRALGRRVSDEFTVPLCRLHHRELHRSRDERAWWSRLGLDSVKIAETLWKRTRLPGPKAAAEMVDGSRLPPAASKAPAPDESTAKSDAS